MPLSHDQIEAIQHKYDLEFTAERGRHEEAMRAISERRLSALSSPASSSPAEAEALPDGVDGLKAAWSFLQDRLLEFEQEIGSGEEEREWAGHVMPALSRLGSLLASLSPAPAQAASGAAGEER